MYKVSFNPQSVWIVGCAIVLAFIVSSAISGDGSQGGCNGDEQ